MNKFLYYIFFQFFIVEMGCAQQLIFSGKITFERKENIHKLMNDNSTWSEAMKNKMPKFRTDFFQLAFNKHQSLYAISQEDESPFANWYYRVAALNTVYTNYETGKMIADKIVYERSYRVEDSISQLKWKMLGEYRNIAGFNCRKAATIIMDSIYVIAFFTDEIPVSAGPESFQGLPGMILGIVIPRMNMTYFATKVENQMISEKDLSVPTSTKNKRINIKSFKDEILKATKDWGEDAPKIYWKVML